jgi:hypothetical protein
MKSAIWEKVKWPYNDAEPYCNWECWQWKKVILYPGQWAKKGWSYVRTGANSDYAHSGFLKGYLTLESAQARIAELVASGSIVP